MGRKIRSEEGGVASSASASNLGAEAQFLVRAYESTTGRTRNEYVSKGTSEDPYVVVCEVSQAADIYFYDYAAYSDDANNTAQGITRTDVTDAQAGGLTMTNSGDYIRINGTPTTEGEYLYSWTIYNVNADAKFDDGTKRKRTFYVKAIVLPAGSTPLWTDSTTFKTTIVRNQSDYTVVEAPSTQSNYANVRYSITGTYPSFLTIDPGTGRLYAAATPNLVQTEYTTYEFTISAVISDDKITVSRSYTAQMKVGDPFDAVYFGPGSAKANPDSYDVAQSTASYLTSAQYSSLWNQEVKAGALRRRTNSRYSTSPYRYNEDYGLIYNEGWGFSSGSIGYLGPKCSSNTNASSNERVVKFLWTVPSGVTEFSVVAVGAGSCGAYNWSSDGGGGGGLAWVNEVTCTPGETFEIAVGLGRRSESSNSSYCGGSTWMRRVEDAGFGANEFIVIGYGGGRQNSHGSPLNGRSNPQSSNLYFIEYYQNNNSRDAGSAAASTRYGTYGAYHGGYANSRGGAGAAGYQGNGANSDNNNGSGGSGGSGQQYSSTYGCSAGGGVGLDGRGSGGSDLSGSGYGGTNGAWTTDYETDGTNSFRYAGGGGSGGSRGCYGENNQTSNGGVQNQYINGGMHGGGGGGSGTSWGGGAGGMGGIRIIWGVAADGTKRAFPATYTTEDPTIADSMNVDGL
jgi:hypothetical protein